MFRIFFKNWLTKNYPIISQGSNATTNAGRPSGGSLNGIDKNHDIPLNSRSSTISHPTIPLSGGTVVKSLHRR